MPTAKGYGTLLEAVRCIRWPARQPLRGGAHGAHLSRVRGPSVEFTEYRAYRQGDETRRIDWKLFARTDRAYIRLSSERVTTPTTIVVDASASMAYPTVTLEKWELACNLTVGLAAVAHAGGDPAGLAIADAGVLHLLYPRTRQGVIADIAGTLINMTPGGSAPLSPVLAAAFRRSARVVIVTDFLGDAEALLSTARHHIAAGREVYALHVVAVEELDPPRNAALFSDPETTDVRRPLREETRGAYIAAFQQWREQLARDWTAAGAFYTMAVADNGPVERIIRRVATAHHTAATAI